MAERKPPDIDQVRDAMREHDERQEPEETPPEQEPETPDEDDED